MRIKSVKCKIINYKGTYQIIPTNKILKFLKVIPITNAKGDIVNTIGGWRDYKSVKWAYNNLMKSDYMEV